MRHRILATLSSAATALAIVGAVTLGGPAPAHAFCGFYVGGAEAELFNNATMVVLMREGTRTVLSMENNYQGPPEDFALVVPVPVVLQKEQVKTLPRAVFERVDKLAAPRLVEYWEQDPCAPQVLEEAAADPRLSFGDGGLALGGKGGGAVRIEAQFEVGEYEIVILSADDSTALDKWLRDNKYNVPAGAEPALKPYVEEGWKFFVAKVNASKVKFKDGMATLSPLRFHYDDDQFRLPVRLGLLNSSGTQDLIVHVLAKGRRYEVANYENVTIPTNLDVSEDSKSQFGAFYAALFDQTLAKNPKSVVTEYAWNAGTCDPCPSPALTPSELATLGADVLPEPNEETEEDIPLIGRVTIGSNDAPPIAQQTVRRMRRGLQKCFDKAREKDPRLSGDLTITAEIAPNGQVDLARHKGGEGLDKKLIGCVKNRFNLAKFPPAVSGTAKLDFPIQFRSVPRPRPTGSSPFVLTRLHTRYAKDALGDDLVFREAKPIVGGREIGAGNTREQGAQEGTVNNFQGRYAIRHPWTGPIQCERPVRGQWGGPTEGAKQGPAATPATNLAFAPRGKVKLAELLRQDVPELGLKGGGQAPPAASAAPPQPTTAAPAPAGGCDCATAHRGAAKTDLPDGWLGLGLFGALGALARRRRRRITRDA